jgi:hypothetical protein
MNCIILEYNNSILIYQLSLDVFGGKTGVTILLQEVVKFQYITQLKCRPLWELARFWFPETRPISQG